MIFSNPVFGFLHRVMLACGLIESQRDSVVARANRAGPAICPFVLVTRAADGKWGVFQQDYDKPLASFGDMQEACDYANERAKTQAGSMVLIGRRQGPAGNSNSTMAEGTT